MMKKVVTVLTIIIFISSAIFGGIKRQTYTDITHGEEYLKQISVAQLPYSIAESGMIGLEEMLSKSHYILAVKVIGDIQHRFQNDIQKVVITGIYAGDKLSIGDEVYLYSDRWETDLGEEPYSIERGFVNIMDVDKEYLVFADSVDKDIQTKETIIKLYSDYCITPIFCYSDKENVTVMGNTDMGSYVAYSEVKNNEFFADSEETLQLMESLKMNMIKRYPR